MAKRTDNNYKQHKIIIITKTKTHTENRSSVNFSHFHLLWNRLTDINQTWQGCWGEGPLQSIYISLWFDEIHGHQRRSSILIGWFSKMFSYEITMQNNLKLYRNVLCEVFYKRSIFGSGWTNKLGGQRSQQIYFIVHLLYDWLNHTIATIGARIKWHISFGKGTAI